MGTLTFHDLKTRMGQALNEVDVLEVLEISVEDLLNRFEDRIYLRLDYLLEEIDFGSEEV